MYRFLLRPRWIVFHLVVIGAIVAMVSLGFWQLDRLDERQTFNRQVIERSEGAPRPIEDVIDDVASGSLTVDEAEWLPVTASGSYLPGQIVEFNQSQGGRAGENVLAALALDDGSTVIVNRGFVPLATPTPTPPEIEVTVVGLVRASEVRSRGQLTDAGDGPVTEVRRIELDRIAPQFPGEVAPFYVQLVAAEPPVAVGDPEPITRPELDDGPHLSYAIQWFVFSVCVAIGWVLAVRRSLGSRRRDAAVLAGADARDGVDTGLTAAGVGRAPAGSSPPDDDAATTAPRRTSSS